MTANASQPRPHGVVCVPTTKLPARRCYHQSIAGCCYGRSTKDGTPAQTSEQTQNVDMSKAAKQSSGLSASSIQGQAALQQKQRSFAKVCEYEKMDKYKEDTLWPLSSGQEQEPRMPVSTSPFCHISLRTGLGLEIPRPQIRLGVFYWSAGHVSEPEFRTPELSLDEDLIVRTQAGTIARTPRHRHFSGVPWHWHITCTLSWNHHQVEDDA